MGTICITLAPDAGLPAAVLTLPTLWSPASQMMGKNEILTSYHQPAPARAGMNCLGLKVNCWWSACSIYRDTLCFLR
ncbi:hypothetical protein DENIT_60537 [Pseudomonas veronii]|nr:hypothetical protein DENIT_60537 [Pseudomonas veronii]